MKKISIIVAVLLSIGLVAWKLADNKAEMAENAKLAEEVSDQIPVETARLIHKKLESDQASIGTFEAVTDLTMLSQTEGLVVKVYKQKGDFVKKGELLAQVENEILKANATAAKANYEKTKADLQRFTKLAESDAVTGRQLEDISIGAANAEAQYRTAQKALDDSYIRATATGTINDDYIQEGSNIGRNAKIYDIVDVSQLKLNVKVTGNNILGINEGDEINITTDIFPTTTYTGKITAVAVKADNSMKYEVEILVNNNNAEKPLKAGMFGKANFEFVSGEDAYYINRDALTGSIKNPSVFVVKDGKARMVRIKVGEVLNQEIQVLDGLSEDDVVVINGQINLKDGTPVRSLNGTIETASK